MYTLNVIFKGIPVGADRFELYSSEFCAVYYKTWLKTQCAVDLTQEISVDFFVFMSHAKKSSVLFTWQSIFPELF